MSDQVIVTDADAINAAADMIEQITSGSLSAAEVQRRALDAARELICVAGVGPDSPLWELHGDITRQHLADGGVSCAEQIEWYACQFRREIDAGGHPPRLRFEDPEAADNQPPDSVTEVNASDN
ncbi:hypothetical protein [Mycobacterium sp.]|uniref:hypothetical protein n=1 Tax=Mycobacterium sp. TaxID=1785 RepID=UPI003F9DE54D